MFNYEEFKMEMVGRGHEVHKNGKVISIAPDNNYLGYTKGFLCATEIIDGYEQYLKFKQMDHYNTHIYGALFEIVEG